MYQMLFLLFVGVVCCFTYIEALECGILDHAAEEHFQEAMKKCTSNSKNYSKEDNDSTESSEEVKAGVKRKLSKRSVEDNTSHEDKSKIQKHNDTDVTENCVLQCIYTNLNMTDTNGYPIEDHITETLLKYARNKETKDLLEDSVEECFQLLKHGGKLDACEYSNQLTTCLAEKGKTTCSDWEPTNLPIHQ